jgi:hypothetical protein
VDNRVALWLWTNHQRQVRYNLLLQAAEMERASLLLENAKTTARRERELNDFIAHEGKLDVSLLLCLCRSFLFIVH